MLTLTVVMFRHGQVYAADKERLEAADPRLNKNWLKYELPGKAKVLRGIKFARVLSGRQTRMTETAIALGENGITSDPLGTDILIANHLDATSTYHNKVIYGKVDPFREYMRDMPEFLRRLHDVFGSSTLLLVTSGARMIPMEALARGLGPEDFADDNVMVEWSLNQENDANPAVGEAWAYTFDPETGRIERKDLASLTRVNLTI